MSNQPHSNQHPANEDNQKNSEELTDDLDFWNVVSDKNEIDSNPNQNLHTNPNSNVIAELEEILAEQEKTQPSQQATIPTQDQELEEILKSTAEQTNVEREIYENFVSPDESEENQPKPEYQKSSVEKIATLACYIAILGVFTYLIIYASQQHNFDTSKPYATNTPAKGEYANVKSIETWWSEPVRNSAKLGVKLVPTATITLDTNSKSGVIRSFFYSYEEGLLGQLRPKGDPLTHEFVDGKFIESGTNEITVHCTDGFEDLAHYAFYRSQEEKRWTIEIKEAPSLQTTVDGFKPLAHAPIEPIQK